MNKRVKRWMRFFILIIAALLILMMSINHYVVGIGTEYTINTDDVPVADAILVLGARVYSDGRLSLMLYDRLIAAQELYEKKKAPKLIVSGDHGQIEYDEVNAMKDFLIEQGIPSEDIFMDHAGFSTYESMYRARDIFKVKKIIIVTQEFHLTRAVFIARELGLEAYGVASDIHEYGQVMIKSRLREIAARNKDFLFVKFIKPEPTYLGDEIPVTGDGRITDDKLSDK